MNSLLLPLAAPPKKESAEDRKVAVIHCMMDIIEKVEHIKPEQRVEGAVKGEPREKVYDPTDMEDPIGFIDDQSYSEEKEIKRLMNNCMRVARKVTFSEPLEHHFLFPPYPPPSFFERSMFQDLVRKFGRFLCITPPDDDEVWEEEMQQFLQWTVAQRSAFEYEEETNERD